MRIMGKTGLCTMSMAAGLLLPATLALGAANHMQHAGKMHEQAASPAKVAPAGDPYLLDKDMVSGQKLDKPVIIQYQGRELRFASQESVKTFRAGPAKYFVKIDEAMIKQQLPYYPLDKCVISGEALGGMGDPVNYIYKNRLVRFCCTMCKGKFEKEPAKYLAKIDEAVVAAQTPGYPLDTCPVSGGKLGKMGKPADHVAGNRLVRFCCPSCVAKFSKDPLPTLAKLQDGKTADSTDHAATGHAQNDHHQTH